jgi:flagellar protein FlaJ
MRLKKFSGLWLISLGDRLKYWFPDLQRTLYQAGLTKSPAFFLAENIKKSFLNSFFYSLALLATAFFTKIEFLKLLSVLIFPILFLVFFLLGVKRPYILVIKRQKLIDRDLPFALRHMLISLRSGIPLYDSLVSLSSNYGEISKEFEMIAKEIAAGRSEVEAIENSILRNPSLEYRKALWQIISAIESGADISDALESIVNAIVEGQIQKVREYGKELSPYTMIYMLFSVVLPSLGITFLIILTTFTALKISDFVFYIIVFGIIAFQYFFIAFIKNRRPMIKM